MATMMAPMMVVVTVMATAMVHHFGARDIVGGSVDAAAESSRQGRGKLWRGECKRGAGQSDEDKLAHAFLSSDSPAVRSRRHGRAEPRVNTKLTPLRNLQFSCSSFVPVAPESRTRRA